MVFLLGTVSGVLLGLSAPPLPTYPLIWIALTPLFLAASQARSLGQALLTGLITGVLLDLILFAGTFSYLGWFSAFAILIYALPYPLLAGLSYSLAQRPQSPLQGSAIIAAGWFLLENLSNHLHLPYSLGLALYHSPWSGAVSTIGISGLSSMTVFFNCLLASLLAENRWGIRRLAIPFAGLTALILIPLFLGHIDLSQAQGGGEELHVRIVQPSWGPRDYLGKGQTELREQTRDLVQMAAQKGEADLILFPENFGLYLPDPVFSDELKKIEGPPMILGGIHHDYAEGGSYNSAFLIDSSGKILFTYDKASLVPLLETAYATPRTPSNFFTVKNHRLAPLICFESFLEQGLRNRADQSSGFLLLANDAWAQGKILPHLHLASLVLHSIEFGRPSLFAGNTISAVIGADGQFQTSPLHQAGYFDFTLSPKRVKTFYHSFGSWFPWFAAGAFLLLCRRRALQVDPKFFIPFIALFLLSPSLNAFGPPPGPPPPPPQPADPPPPSLSDGLNFCYRFFADDDAGQCGGATGVQCAPLNNWTPALRIDTDGRSGGCWQQFSVRSSNPSAEEQQLRFCVDFVQEDDHQCDYAGTYCAPLNQWTTIYRIDADNRSGGCRQRFQIVSSNADYSFETEYRADEDAGQCYYPDDHPDNQPRIYRSDHNLWSPFLRIDTDNRPGGCWQKFKLGRGDSQTPRPSPPSCPTSWLFCATENGSCSFSGTTAVRYGESGVYTGGTFTDGVACNNSVFGDPLYGVVKHCDYCAPSSLPSPRCGDGICNGSDSCSNCPADCGACSPQPICGNGVVESGAGEQCDDGNTRDGDGCSWNCQFQAIDPSPVPWSINLHPENVYNYSGDSRRPYFITAIDRIKDLGAQFIRIDIPWSDVQPWEGGLTDDNWDYGKWSLLGSFVSYAKGEGLEPIVVLSRQPNWALNHYQGGSRELYWQEWRRFCRKAALELNRFVDVRYYQLANEANLGIATFRDPIDEGDDWRQFTECHAGISRGEELAGFNYPFKTVVNVHTCGSIGWEGDLQDWLNRAGSSIDIIGIDDYPGSHCPNGATDWSDLDRLFNYLGNGREGAIAETGYTTRNNPFNWFATERDQRNWIQAALPVIKSRTAGRIVFANYYELFDGNSDGLNPEDHYGVLTTDGREKEGYQALKDQIRGRAAQSSSGGVTTQSVASQNSYVPGNLPPLQVTPAVRDCRDQTPEDTTGDPCNHSDCPDGSPQDGIGDSCNHSDCPDGSPQDGTGDSCNHSDCPDRSAQDGWGDPCNHGDCPDGSPQDGIGDSCIHNDCPDRSPRDGMGDPCNHSDCPDGSPQDGVGDSCIHNDCADRSPQDGIGDVCNHSDCSDGSPQDGVGDSCNHGDCPDRSPQDGIGDSCNHNDCADRTPQDAVGDPCNHQDCSDRSPQDGIGDPCRHDEDGDGIADGVDVCPFDPTHDTVGNPCNHDEDGDGVPDSVDLFPFDPHEWADNDHDGIGDNADPDDDNDGIPDTLDRHPFEPNRPPVLQALGDQVVDENQPLTFDVTGGDPDGDPITYRAENLPLGAGFDPESHRFSWTPTYDQAGLYEGIRFAVSDGYLEDAMTIRIAVAQVDRPPVLDQVTSQTVAEGSRISFSVTASDPDLDPLTFRAENLPSGTTFDNGSFDWQTNRLQQGIYSITFEVSDGQLSDRKTVTITVVDESAPSDVQNFRAEPGEGDGEIVLQWERPPEEDFRGVRVLRKAGAPIESLIDGETVYEGTDTSFLDQHLDDRPTYFYKAFTFDDVQNFSPGVSPRPESLPPRDLAPPSSATGLTITPVAVGLQLTWVNPSDPDFTAVILERGSGGHLYEGLAGQFHDPIVGSGRYCYHTSTRDRAGNLSAPTENVCFDFSDPDQDGIDNSIDGDDDNDGIPDTLDRHPFEPNRPPVLQALGDQVVDENQPLTFDVTGGDPDGDPLTWRAENLPPGAGFDPESHRFSWTPTYDQAGLYEGIQFAVSDGYLEDTLTLRISVQQVNRPPVLDPIANQTIQEASHITFIPSASDPDGDPLTFQAENLPPGASFDPIQPLFDWQTDRLDQGLYPITFEVSDGELSDRQTVTITILDSSAPSEVTNFTAVPGEMAGEEPSTDPTPSPDGQTSPRSPDPETSSTNPSASLPTSPPHLVGLGGCSLISEQ